MTSSTTILLSRIRTRDFFQKTLWFIVFLAYVNPGYLDRFTVFGLFTTFVKLTVFSYFLLFGVLRKRISVKILPWIGYSLFPALITIIHTGDVKSELIFSFTILSVAFIFFYMDYRHIYYLVGGLATLMVVLVVINIATIVLVPNGLYLFETDSGWSSRDVWFFGLRNSHTPFLILACFSTVIDYFLCGGRWRWIVTVSTHIVCIITVVLLSSGGGMVSFSLYYALLLVLTRKQRTDINPVVIKTWMMVFVSIIVFLFLSFFAASTNIADTFSFLGDQRVYTMGRRIDIWETVMDHILVSPVWGFGFMNANDLVWLSSLAAGAVSSHNSMMDIWFRGGFVTLLVYYIMLISAGRDVDNNSHINYQLKNYLAVSWFTILLLLQVEGSVMSIPLLSIIGITYVLGKLLKADILNISGLCTDTHFLITDKRVY